MVVNIPGGDLSKGTVLTPYAGPSPPKGSGLHRYIFLVYKQQGEVNVSATVKAQLYVRTLTPPFT